MAVTLEVASSQGAELFDLNIMSPTTFAVISHGND